MVQQMMKGMGKGKMPKLPKDLADLDLGQFR